MREFLMQTLGDMLWTYGVLGFHGGAFIFSLRALRIAREPSVPISYPRTRQIGLIAVLIMLACGFLALLVAQIWLHTTFLLLVIDSGLGGIWWGSPQIFRALFTIWIVCAIGSSALLFVFPVIGGELGKRTWRSFRALRRIGILFKRAVRKALRWIVCTRLVRALNRHFERYDHKLW